jgi:hypothetical protein
MKKIKIIVEKTSTGFSAYSEKLPVFTTGTTVGEIVKNIIEGLELYFEESGESKTITVKNLELSYSIPSLFELYPINVRHFAERIGMNYTLLAQYVQGRKNPSGKQAAKIVEGLHEVGRELSEVNLI